MSDASKAKLQETQIMDEFETSFFNNNLDNANDDANNGHHHHHLDDEHHRQHTSMSMPASHSFHYPLQQQSSSPPPPPPPPPMYHSYEHGDITYPKEESFDLSDNDIDHGIGDNNNDGDVNGNSNGNTTLQMLQPLLDQDDDLEPIMDMDNFDFFASLRNTPLSLARDNTDNQKEDNSNIVHSLETRIQMAALCLRNYEHGRSLCNSTTSTSTTNTNSSEVPMSITPLQLHLAQIRDSNPWQIIVGIAIGLLFASSLLEGEYNVVLTRPMTCWICTVGSCTVFFMDLMLQVLYATCGASGSRSASASASSGTKCCNWKWLTQKEMRGIIAMMIFTCAILLETTIKVWFLHNGTINEEYGGGGNANPTDQSSLYIWCGILKPGVFFYTSSKARDGRWYCCHCC